MTVFVQRSDASLNYTYDWSRDIPETVTLVSVTNILPSPLSIVAEVVDSDEQTSTVQIAGAVHGQTYQIRALATLSNGEQIPGDATLRGFNG